MRLVGLLATCFLLLSVLIFGFQHRKEIGLQFADRISEMLPAEGAVVDANASALPAADAPTEVVMPMREAGRLNALTGFPGYAKASFALPRSSVAQTGVLVLDLNGDIETDAQGLLRITVNGIPRSEIVLEEGRLRRRIMVPLNIRDLAGRSVSVALSAEGRIAQAECSADWDGGIVAQILPSSHVKLALDAPLSDPADLLLAQMAPLQLEWPTDTQLRTQALKAAHLQSVEGNILFAAAGTGGLEVDEPLLKALENQPGQLAPLQADPLDLAAALGRKRSVAFEGQAQWRASFDRRSVPQAAPAAELNLALVHDAAGGEGGWLLSVLLNDRLVHSEAVTQASGRIERRIALPAGAQAMVNDLRVTLTSAETREGRCARPRPATADIERARLVLAAPQGESLWSGLLPVITGALNLAAHPQLDASGAQLSLDLMNTLLGGSRLDLHSDGGDPGGRALLTAVPVQALPDLLAQADRSTSWVLMASEADALDVTVVKATDVDVRTLASAPRAVLLLEQRPNFASASAE